MTGDLIDIPIINKDFAVELKDTNALLKFIGAAFGMAGGLVAFGRFGELDITSHSHLAAVARGLF